MFSHAKSRERLKTFLSAHSQVFMMLNDHLDDDLWASYLEHKKIFKLKLIPSHVDLLVDLFVFIMKNEIVYLEFDGWTPQVDFTPKYLRTWHKPGPAV